MAPPFPSLTPTWHEASYPAISPTRPELSAAGKTIVITGGGTGIGASIARSFAAAGSKRISVIGRRPAPLENTARELESEFAGLRVLVCVADVTNKPQVDEAFSCVAETFGPIDILVSNAGYVTQAVNLIEMDPDDAWTSFETHARGAFHLAQAFSRTLRQGGAAVVVETSSIVVAIPPFPGSSAYTASKIAATTIWSYFGAENPEVRVVSFQPGQIDTDMARKIGLTPVDDVSLPGNFVVWLSSPEAHFLDGKFVCANWDVDELIDRKEEFEKMDLGSLKLSGFPSLKF